MSDYQPNNMRRMRKLTPFVLAFIVIMAIWYWVKVNLG